MCFQSGFYFSAYYPPDTGSQSKVMTKIQFRPLRSKGKPRNAQHNNEPQAMDSESQEERVTNCLGP